MKIRIIVVKLLVNTAGPDEDCGYLKRESATWKEGLVLWQDLTFGHNLVSLPLTSDSTLKRICRRRSGNLLPPAFTAAVLLGAT